MVFTALAIVIYKAEPLEGYALCNRRASRIDDVAEEQDRNDVDWGND
jgi:hypothetical protein